jgi:DNA topoisomerase-3
VHVLLPTFAEKKYLRKSVLAITTKGSTVNLKDFKSESGLIEGLLRFDTDFKLKLEPKKKLILHIKNDLSCPKCLNGKYCGKYGLWLQHYKVVILKCL